MRSNNQNHRQFWQTIKQISPITNKLKDLVSLGLEGKQWLASLLICLMLLPLFALPAGAAIPAGNAGPDQFEPVNEKLSVWTAGWRSLNAKIESWTTPWRRENALPGESDDDKKKKKKANDANSEKKNDKNLAEEETIERSEPKSNEKVETNTEIVKSEKEPSNSSLENNKEVSVKNKPSAAAPLFNQLPDNERESVYSYENNLGAPFGQVEKDSPNQAAAIRIQHRAGIANFSFEIPLAVLSGRGIDAGVGLTYNSRTWNKSCLQYDPQGSCSQNHFTYDVEQSWIAPGFSSGFGYLESFAFSTGSGGIYKIQPQGITDEDGTRHQFTCKTFIGSTCAVFESTDGTYIRTGGEAVVSNLNSYANTNFTVTYPNGTKVYYAGAFGGGNIRKHYPIIIQDSNGNRIHIAYKSDQSGRIDYVTDTLNRKIQFYYETDANGNPDKLVAVTIPGMTENSEIQTVRFYYQDLTLNSAGKFNGQITAPTSIRVLQYVYLPATKTGYKYEYATNYGMIRKITRQVGMTAGTTATNTTGTLTEGIFAASTEYDYPDGATALDDVPNYTKRTDDWQGRTAALPQETFYNVPEPTIGNDNLSQITVKDNGFDLRSETRLSNSGDWQSGLIKEISVTKVGSGTFPDKLMSKIVYIWAPGTGTTLGRRNPKLQKIEVTNEAGLTKATEFEYDQYNNQTKAKEYDYGTNAALLRTTEIEYETGSGWVNANILGLTKSVKTIVNNTTVSKTLYEYDHNGSDQTITKRSDIDIATHDTFYNPDRPAWDETVCPDGNSQSQSALPDRCVTIHHYGYTAASAYRGNVTTVKGVLISDLNANNVADYDYDIAGNVVSATLSCCNFKTNAYDKANEYAFPISETKGTSPTQLTTSVTYNRNTGLVLTSTDENAQVTSYEYEPDTLRPKKTIYPSGGFVLAEYSDKLITNPNNLLPGFVRTTTTLDSSHTAQSYSYFNGRGDGFRSATQTPDGWSIAAAEFDKLGRPVKSYNPFYVSTPTGAIPAATKFTEVLSYDALGRTTSVRLQDNTTISTEFSDLTTTPPGFNKTFVTVTDQAGKQRRQIYDALSRAVRIDEPDPSGNLGAVESPNQPTSYEYDGNNNLAKVTQSDGTTTQERLFKHDSLGRLTHERQVEANATLNDDGVKQTSGGMWTKVLKYNADGLLTDGYDARGVNAHFNYDNLNRVQSVTFSDGTPTETYTYDQEQGGSYNKGKLTRIETADGGAARPDTPTTATEFDYDKMGRVVKHRQSIGNQIYSLEYAYNLAGQLISEKYPSGKTISMSYDANGRLLGLADQSRTYLGSLQYQQSGGILSSMTLGNGTTQTFAFNDRLQMTNHTLSKAGEVIQKYDYGYGQIDSNGNLDPTKNNNQLAKIESYIGTNKQWTQKFSYDSLGRLAEAKEYRGDTNALSYKQKFDFDRFGNLYRKQSSNPPTGQENPLPYTPVEAPDISRSTNRLTAGTTYDEAGNVTTDNKFRALSFNYDANGRVIKAIKANTQDALSVYDSSGQRVAEKISGVWRFLIYDLDSRLVAEYGGLQSADEGGVKYVLEDHQGSTRAILSNTGFVQARRDYQAFGEEIGVNVGLRTENKGFGTANNLRYKYGLTERDEATGLDNTWFRKYENQAGRWTSPDPFTGSINLANPQSFNRYSYVENQPTNFVDPSGLLLQAYWTCHYENDQRVCSIRFFYSPDPGGGGGGGGGGGQQDGEKKKECPVAPLKYPTDADGQRFEAAQGDIVDTGGLTEGTRNALDCLKSAIEKVGGTANPTSGWRPESYQAHFVDLWNKRKELKKYGKECQKLKNEVNKEINAVHQITGAPDPVDKSRHVKGTAFDIAIGGVNGRQINAFANKCGLVRAKGDGEGHHFNFVGQEPRWRTVIWV
ncbi:MAG: RHS repeat-associated core domain-containing protein [Actinomycetota bacterium]